MRCRLHIVALAVAVSAGCRCGGGCRSEAPESGAPGFVWKDDAGAGDIPAGRMDGVLGGDERAGWWVQVRETGQGGAIVEILDEEPSGPCVRSDEAQGFTVRLPDRPEPGTSLRKTMRDPMLGLSAYTVTRDPDGSSTSTLAQDWALILEVGDVDRAGGRVTGRLYLALDDGQRSGVAGEFAGDYCPVPGG